MAFAQFTAAPNNATDATFRAWGSALSAQLAAMGLVQTADTGQINWATVLTPSTTNQSRGYEIWRFNDALQASSPIYFKLEYGSSGGAAAPGVWITVSSGTDGAGNVLAPSTARTAFGSSTSNANVQLCAISGSSSRLVFILWYAGTGFNSNLQIFCSIERTKDTAGADTAEGVLIAFCGGNNVMRQEFYQPGVGSTGQETTFGIMYPAIGSGSSGSQVAVYPCLFSKGVFLNPGMNFLGYFTANVTPFVTVAITIYGAAHTYFPLQAVSPVVARQAAGGNVTTALVSLLLRYE